MKPVIRKLGPGDLADIVSLIREFAEVENLISYCAVNEDRLYHAMFAKDAIVEGYAVSVDDILIAYALFYPGFSSFRGELGFNLEDLYVREEHRGKGIGKMLLQKVAKSARDRGFVRLDLMVNSQNSAARAFYEKLGASCNSDERHFKFSDKAFKDLAS